MLCSHCNQYIKVSDITQQRGKGFDAQVRCPHCTAWLGRSPTLAKLKLLGFYLSVFTADTVISMPQCGTLRSQ
nr:hypothetical protein [Shewanella sp. Pdp11]